MAKITADEFRAKLEELGLVEHEDFDVEGRYSTMSFTVNFEVPPRELPEELKPFAEKDLDRAIRKGNATKQTYDGADFELALHNYAYDLLAKDPQAQALEASLNAVNSMEELAAYREARTAIWERICLDPKIVAWERDLEENYL